MYMYYGLIQKSIFSIAIISLKFKTNNFVMTHSTQVPCRILDSFTHFCTLMFNYVNKRYFSSDCTFHLFELDW